VIETGRRGIGEISAVCALESHVKTNIPFNEDPGGKKKTFPNEKNRRGQKAEKEKKYFRRPGLPRCARNEPFVCKPHRSGRGKKKAFGPHLHQRKVKKKSDGVKWGSTERTMAIIVCSLPD